MSVYCSRDSGTWENGTDKWGGLQSYVTANVIQSNRQFMIWMFIKVIWINFSVTKIFMSYGFSTIWHKNMFFTEAYKHIIIASYNVESKVKSLISSIPGRSTKTSQNNSRIWRNWGHKVPVLFSWSFHSSTQNSPHLSPSLDCVLTSVDCKVWEDEERKDVRKV